MGWKFMHFISFPASSPSQHWRSRDGFELVWLRCGVARWQSGWRLVVTAKHAVCQQSRHRRRCEKAISLERQFAVFLKCWFFDKTVFWSNKKKQARANIDLMCVKNIRCCLVKVVQPRLLLLLYAVSSECVSIKRLVSWHSWNLIWMRDWRYESREAALASQPLAT